MTKTISPNAPTDLSGNVAFITGAGSGLGRRFARTLALSGAKVHLSGRRLEPLLSLKEELVGLGCTVTAASMDICDADAISGAILQAESELGTVDILVNNAGVSDADFATRLDLERIDQVIDTNFRGPFIACREVANRLIQAGKPGRIVNLSSVGAFHYQQNSASALYCATKAGIVRMTETLAIEWARYNINVNAIAPGMFYSEMTDGFIERVGEGFQDRYPRKRIGSPEWLDSTLLYLVDPRSHFINGTCIIADDAQVAR